MSLVQLKHFQSGGFRRTLDIPKHAIGFAVTPEELQGRHLLEMGRQCMGSVLALLGVLSSGPSAAQDGSAPAPSRINKAIELLEKGQPVYYTTAVGGYEQGLEFAGTESDYINYEMEHGPFDIAALREFMRGLVDGGPTSPRSRARGG